MDIKSLLFKCFTLLAKESRLSDNPPSLSLVKSIISAIDFTTNPSNDDLFYIGLKGILDTTIKTGEESGRTVFDAGDIASQIDLLTHKNIAIANVIINSMKEISVDDDRVCSAIRHQLGNLVSEKQLVEVLESTLHTVKYKRYTIPNLKEYKEQFIQRILSTNSLQEDDGVVSDVNFDDIDSVINCFNQTAALNDGALFKFGLQELNNALDGGGRLGESIAVYALKHRYKTGFTLSLLDDIATKNEPVKRKENKKPLIIHLSCEDPIALNFKFLYEKAICEEKGYVPDLRNVSAKEMASVVQERLKKTGFHVLFRHIKGNEWNYSKLVSYFNRLISQGYDIQAVTLDYLLKIPTTGFTAVTTGSDIIQFYDALRNYFLEKGILFITPFQLSPESYSVLRNDIGEEDFVKAVAGKGYMAGSKKIGEIADCELYVHSFTKSSRNEKQGYLAIQLDKHKGYVIDPTTKYMLYPFFGKGPVLSDLNKNPTHLKDLSEVQGVTDASFDF